MISDLLARLNAKTAPEARALGLWKEHRDIAQRHARVRAAWAGHLAASRAAILAAAVQVSPRRRCVVLGAGDCLDVPVAELAGIFEEVVLADVVIGREARRLEKLFPGRVRAVVWDASGALARLAPLKESVEANEAARIFGEADPGPPPGGEADLLVSANCVSQLGLVPGHSLPACQRDPELPQKLAQSAGRRHVDWLRQRPGVRLLLADVAELDLGPDGKLQKQVNLHERFGLPPPGKSWRWDLAPIPDWSPDFSRVHDVGAWLWPNGSTEIAGFSPEFPSEPAGGSSVSVKDPVLAAHPAAAPSGGWWAEYWRSLVIVAVLVAAMAWALWPKSRPTVVLPEFEQTETRVPSN